MISKKNLTGIVLAVGAASMFALTPVVANATSHSGMIRCAGVNACKGHSSCKTTANACKGRNACKGQGFVAMNKTQCEQIGGKIE